MSAQKLFLPVSFLACLFFPLSLFFFLLSSFACISITNWQNDIHQLWRGTQHLSRSLNIWWQYFLIADTVQNFSYDSSPERVCVCNVRVGVWVCVWHDHVGRAEMYFAYLQKGSSPGPQHFLTKSPTITDPVPLCTVLLPSSLSSFFPLSLYLFLFLSRQTCHDCSPMDVTTFLVTLFSKRFLHLLSLFFCSCCCCRTHPLGDCVLCRVAQVSYGFSSCRSLQ